MSRIKIGDQVRTRHKNGQKCLVTGIILRGKGFREYQCSYTDSNGHPTSNWLLAAEIEKAEGASSIGFKRKEGQNEQKELL